MPDIKWIKITTEMFDDEKIRIIEAMPEADTLIVLWIRLICMAGKVNAGGHIFLSPELPYDDEQLAAVFNRPLNTVRLALETFKRLHMIELTEEGHIFLPKFEQHQNIEGMELVREATRKRVASFRKREQLKLLPAGTTEEESTHVTLRNATVTVQNRIEKNRKEEIREDDNILIIWESILLLLKNSMNKQNYKTWFEGSIGIEINDKEIIVGVSHEDKASHIENSMLSLVEKCIFEASELPLKLRLILIEK